MKRILKLLLLFIFISNVSYAQLTIVRAVAVDGDGDGNYGTVEFEFSEPISDTSLLASALTATDWVFSLSEDFSDPVNGQNMKTSVNRMESPEINIENDVYASIYNFNLTASGNIYIKYTNNGDTIWNADSTNYLADITKTVGLDTVPPELISNVTFNPSSLLRLVGDSIRVTVTAADAEIGLLGDSLRVNNTIIHNDSLIDNNDGTYSFRYWIKDGDNDIADSEKIPVAIRLKDSCGFISNIRTSTLDENSHPAIDANIPAVGDILASRLTTTRDTLKVGDQIQFTIQPVEAELNLTIAPLRYNSSIDNLAWTADATGANYTATYEVVEGQDDQWAPLQLMNVTLEDPNGQVSTPFNNTSVLWEIDANSPEIEASGVTITDNAAGSILKIGDKLTFTVDVLGSEYPLDVNQTQFNGKDLNWQTVNAGDTYVAVYTVQNGDGDIPSPIQLTDVKLIDLAGNETQVSQSSNSLAKSVDATPPEISDVYSSAEGAVDTLIVDDVITFTVEVTTPELGLQVTPTTYNGRALNWIADGTGAKYAGTYTVTENDPDHLVNPLQLGDVRLEDVNGNISSVFSYTGVTQLIDAHTPQVQSVTSDATSAGTLIVGESITFTVDVVTPDGSLTVTPDTYNGQPLNWQTNNGGNTYTGVYTVTENDQDYLVTPLQLEGVVLTDPAGNATDPAVDGTDVVKLIDAHKPVISSVALKDVSKSIGDQDTLYITIDSDPDFGSYSLISGTVADYPISLIEPIDDTTIRVLFTITSRTFNIDSAATVEVKNLQLADGAGNKCVVFEDLSVANDKHAIFSKRPSAEISGDDKICDKDSTQIPIFLSGYAPFSITYTDGTTTKTINSINKSLYKLTVVADLDLGNPVNYTITNVTDATGNMNNTVKGPFVLNIDTLPNAAFVNPSNGNVFDVSQDTVDLEGNYTSGIFSGVGVLTSSNQFSPKIAGIDYHDLFYTYQDANGCSDSDKITVRVIEGGTITFAQGKTTYCSYTDTFSVIGYNNLGNPGSFLLDSDPGDALDNISTDTAIIKPEKLTAGTWTIRYIYAGGDDIVTTFVVEQVNENVGFAFIGDLCADYDLIEIMAQNLTPVNGNGYFELSDAGVNLHASNNGNKIAIDPGDLTPDGLLPKDYLLTYFYKTQNGCSSDTLKNTFKVNPLPQVELPMAAVYNIYDGKKSITPSHPNGSYSPLSYWSDITSTKANFNPEIAGLGNDTAWYTYTDANGCTNTDTAFFLVNEPAVVIAGLNKFEYSGVEKFQYCYFNSQSDTITVDPIDLTWTDKKFFIDNVEITQFSTDSILLDPSNYNAGSHIIKYSYKDNGVYYEVDETFYVDSIGNFNFTGLDASYCEDDMNPNSLILIPPSGESGSVIYTGNGIVADAFIPMLATDGNHTITAQFIRETTGCIKYHNKSTTVNTLPIVTLSMSDVYNIDGGKKTITPTPGNGNYTPLAFWSNVTQNSADFDPVAAGLGIDTAYYTYTDANGCTNTDTAIFNVRLANASFVGLDQQLYQGKTYNQYCYFNSMVDTITVNVNAALWTDGKFFIDDVEQSLYNTDTILFNPLDFSSGNHTLKYTYNESGVDYFIETTLDIDSIGNIFFTGLEPEYCEDDNREITLTGIYPGSEGSVLFTGNGIIDLVDDEFAKFNPSMAMLGDNTVKYTFTRDYSNCYKEYNQNVVINQTPYIAFSPDKACITSRIDSVLFTSDTLGVDNVIGWDWYIDNTVTIRKSTKKSPKFSLVEQVKNYVLLTLTTDKGCTSSKDSSIFIGSVVDIDFTWDKECDGETVTFDVLKSTDPLGVDSVSWNFGGDGTENIVDEYKPQYTYSEAGGYDVTYYEYTSTCGLISETKRIIIRPSITIGGENYFEDFETNPDITGWAVDVLGSSGNYSWEWGQPQGTKIASAVSGSNAFVTNLDGNYANNEKSYISSPCFDFSQLQKPMIRFDFISALELSRDGVVLQYSINKDQWESVGAYGQGINWYNSFNLNSNILGQSSGWTANGLSLNTAHASQWNTAKFWLDDVAGESGVRFRFTLGSDDYNSDEGFAFDNMWIGDRNRMVLLEHFANTANEDFQNVQNVINNIFSSNPMDVIPIQYFTSFPTPNEISSFYTAGPSARSLYYGISKSPYSVVDGGDRKFNYSSTNTLGSTDVNKRMLEEARFTIDVFQGIEGGQLNTKATVRALDSISSEKLSVRMVVVENSVESYVNVIRTMLPDPAGILLDKEWEIGDSVNLYQNWLIPDGVIDENLITVVFIQNEETKEVYQTAYTDVYTTITNMDDQIQKPLEYDYLAYPNPVSEQLTVKILNPVRSDLTLNIINSAGMLIKVEQIRAGDIDKIIDVSDIPQGIYFLKLDSQNEQFKTKKIIIE